MPDKARRVRTTRRGAGEGTLPDVSALPGWRPARHVVDPVTVKLPTRRVTINLDEDLVAIFKA